LKTVKIPTLPISPEPSTLQEIEDTYWHNPDTHDKENETNDLLTLPDDVPCLRRSIRNLRYHQPIDAKVLKTTSVISVKQVLIMNEKKAILAIMDETNNILRSFMFIKQNFFPDGNMDKLKERLVADGSQQGRHFMTVSHRPQCLYKWYFYYIM